MVQKTIIYQLCSKFIKIVCSIQILMISILLSNICHEIVRLFKAGNKNILHYLSMKYFTNDSSVRRKILRPQNTLHYKSKVYWSDIEGEIKYSFVLKKNRLKFMFDAFWWHFHIRTKCITVFDYRTIVFKSFRMCDLQLAFPWPLVKR